MLLFCLRLVVRLFKNTPVSNLSTANLSDSFDFFFFLVHSCFCLCLKNNMFFVTLLTDLSNTSPHAPAGALNKATAPTLERCIRFKHPCVGGEQQFTCMKRFFHFTALHGEAAAHGCCVRLQASRQKIMLTFANRF